MERPMIRIEARVGNGMVSYDATHVTVVKRPQSAGYMVAFECNGELHVLPPEDVQSVVYTPAGGTTCPWCAAPLQDA